MSNCYASTAIALAKKEVGYKETGNNVTKYANDFDTKYPDFYNYKKQGVAWCDMFFDWLMVTSFGEDNALRLTCQPRKSAGAGCKFSYGYYKAKGQTSKIPTVGAQIFFGKTEDTINHTGIVVAVDSAKVYTIEGNSDNKVAKHSYALTNANIYGYGHPAYDAEVVEAPKETSTTPVAKEEDKKEITIPTENKPIETTTQTMDTSATARTIQKGCRGDDVKQLQQNLNTVIAAGLEVDGITGSLTDKAIRNFQSKYGLEVDGKFGPKSSAKMIEVLKTASITAPTISTTQSSTVTKPTIQSTTSEFPYQVKIICPKGMYVRAGAGTNYSIVGSVRCGATLTIYSRIGSWGKVSSNQNKWVCIADVYAVKV